MGEANAPRAAHDYIVVGSGAGGGTLAARLAEEGRSVLVLEAGGDAGQLTDSRLPEDHQVPAFHPFASENPALRWDFFVRHYTRDEFQKKDSKYVEDRDGVLYPRAGTLGGCTAHNAMVLVYPHNSDWDEIARATGDSTWEASNMRRYFERLEDCQHRPLKRWISRFLGWNPARHGFDGWLSTELAVPVEALGSGDLRKVLEESAVKASSEIGDRLKRLRWFLKTRGDPNDWRLVKANSFGIRLVPISTRDHVRDDSRSRLLDVALRHSNNLRIELDALVSQVLFDANNRAIGVEYLKGERLYRAHANPSENSGEKRRAHAAKEVILCGGAFNTPQLLMLSGIGPADILNQFGIGVKVDLPGVGKNLQDRYEVSVVNRMKADWKLLAGAKFSRDDRHYREWQARKEGIYTTNGGVLAVIKKSQPARIPDLFCLGLLGKFEGYFPGYSKLIAEHHDYLSWVVLKAHTVNSGIVTLRSADPREPPHVNFRYFDDGNERSGGDLDAVVDGLKFVRSMSQDLKREGLIAAEELPGERVQTDEELKHFVRDNAWGHHASCTCPIGPREKGGVLTSDFRVHGTHGLRVVDASVFPRIPGFFIVSAIYMIGEKAADVILADAND